MKTNIPIESLNRIVAYLEHDEGKHFQECIAAFVDATTEPTEEQKEREIRELADHIYCHILNVKHYVALLKGTGK